MKPSIYKVEQMSSVSVVNTKNGPTNKQQLVLREFGDQFSDAYVVTVFGDIDPKIQVGQLCIASLSSVVNEYDGRFYQENWCRSICVI